jgi:hypothetical protein
VTSPPPVRDFADALLAALAAVDGLDLGERIVGVTFVRYADQSKPDRVGWEINIARAAGNTKTTRNTHPIGQVADNRRHVLRAWMGAYLRDETYARLEAGFEWRVGDVVVFRPIGENERHTAVRRHDGQWDNTVTELSMTDADVKDLPELAVILRGPAG